MLKNQHFIPKQFRVIAPYESGSFDRETDQCFQQLAALKVPHFRVVALTFFIDAAHGNEFTQRQRHLLDRCSGPAFLQQVVVSVVSQKPVTGQIGLEVILAKVEPEQLNLKHLNGIRYLKINHAPASEIIAFGLRSGADGSITRQSEEVFSAMQAILNAEQMTMGHVVRQWNYIEDITCERITEAGPHQHYQEFNNVRANYYNGSNWPDGYPAATGIGIQFGGVSVDFIAIAGNPEGGIMPITSPVQYNAHQYSPQVLVGRIPEAPDKVTPKFERAKAVLGQTIMIYVSGTASIKGEQTIGNTPVEQTHNTLKSILALVSAQNLARHGIALANTLTCSQLRVYLRQGVDGHALGSILQQYFANTPHIMVTGNVCRNGLLVEIEAVFAG